MRILPVLYPSNELASILPRPAKAPERCPVRCRERGDMEAQLNGTTECPGLRAFNRLGLPPDDSAYSATTTAQGCPRRVPKSQTYSGTSRNTTQIRGASTAPRTTPDGPRMGASPPAARSLIYSTPFPGMGLLRGSRPKRPPARPGFRTLISKAGVAPASANERLVQSTARISSWGILIMRRLLGLRAKGTSGGLKSPLPMFSTIPASPCVTQRAGL